MAEIGVHEAKSTLSDLLRRVAAGEEIIITRSGEQVAKIVPMPRHGARTFGADRGLFEVPEDFDGPLPDDLLSAFEGG